MELLALSVGIGLAVSLLLTELFGVASAGLVVPGYLALYVTQPRHIAATLGIALGTFACVQVLSTFLIIYGRRRTALMILIGYVLGLAVTHWSTLAAYQFNAIGLIIPGLIAIWFDRQTVVETLASLTVVTVTVRLILVLTVGAELIP